MAYCKTVVRRYSPSIGWNGVRWVLSWEERGQYTALRQHFHGLGTNPASPMDTLESSANIIIIEWRARRWKEMEEKARRIRDMRYRGKLIF